jgi:hypothetical protein
MGDQDDAAVLAVWAAGSRLAQAAAVRALSEDMQECVREHVRSSCTFGVRTLNE